MRRAIVVLSLIISFPFRSYAQISGVVLDPQGLHMPGVRVALVCEDNVESAITNSAGRFQLAPKTSENACEIRASHGGFDPYRQTVIHERELTLRLRLAKLSETVQVTTSDFFRENPIAYSSLNSISLDDHQLAKISNDTASLIGYAKLAAGAIAAGDVVHVDGIPSYGLPPAELISRILVNSNPFSAQYGEGNQNYIDIFTKAPPRKLRFAFGGAPSSIGGGDVLVRGSRSISKSVNFTLAGPVPHTPMSFSLHSNWGHNTNDLPLIAVLPEDVDRSESIGGNPRSLNRNGSAALDVYYSEESLRASFSYNEAQSSGSNQGIGGLTLPEGGYATSFHSRNMRFGLNWTGKQILYRGGFTGTEGISKLWANSSQRSISVLGSFIAGGAAFTRNYSRRADWTWTNILESNSPRPSWIAGVGISRTTRSMEKIPNAMGMLQFESLESYTRARTGEQTGTFFFVSGNGNVRRIMVTASPFVQKTLLRSNDLLVTGGIRLEYQSSFGMLASPRLTVAKGWRGFVFRSGAGLFVSNLANDVLTTAVASDSNHLRQYIFPNVSFDDLSQPALDNDMAIHTVVAPNLGRAKQVMLK
ncbi:MAG: TonB-dependent receptor, partial [Acidobacteria bacterium]|nr:TonB-dependent receptor [Acidobacteriota bacterium]